MRRTTAYITIALIAVLLAAVVSLRIFFGNRDTEAPDETPQVNPPVTQAIELPETIPPTEAVIETTPPPTEPPVFETRPPIETPAPTPTPIPASASGSFSSSTGTNLNLLAEWSAYTDGSGQPKLRVDLYAVSYSFYTDALWNALELTVNGQTYSASSSAVRYDGETITRTLLGSFTVDAPSGSVSLSAVWHYRGSYSGVELEDITASGTAYLG